MVNRIRGNRRMNNSGNVGAYRPFFDSRVRRTIDSVYITLSVADIIFNSIMCFLFYKDKSLRKPFHILLLNLSLVDMSSAFTIQPYIWIDRTKTGNSSVSEFLCASSAGLVFFLTSLVVNILTVWAVAVIRYLSIVRNYQGRIVTSNTITISFCVFTWIIGAATNIPNGLSFQYNKFEAICYRKWPKGINRRAYTLLASMLLGMLPTFHVIICCTALVIHIWKRSFEAPGQNIAAVRARKKVAILVGLLTFTLILCWTPLSSIWMLGEVFDYFPKGLDGDYEKQRLQRVLAIFALLNSILDPFIYILSCSEYRKGIQKFICTPLRRCCHCKVRDIVHN